MLAGVHNFSPFPYTATISFFGVDTRHSSKPESFSFPDYGSIGRVMASSIIINDIQLNAFCGVTESERSQPQPILVDLTVRSLNEAAFQSDQLSDTIDYSAITQCIRDIGERHRYTLLEKLTEDVCQTLFQQFPLTHLKIWVRKIRAPIQDFSGSVGIRLIRSRQEILQAKHGHPSPFLISQLPRLPRGKAGTARSTDNRSNRRASDAPKRNPGKAGGRSRSGEARNRASLG